MNAPRMDDTYLVEIRLARTKWRIRELTSAIARAYGIDHAMERHPHITLFGPFTLRDGVTGREILSRIGEVARSCAPVDFCINGWERREGMHGSVIAFTVRPSVTLRSLTESVSSVLGPVSDSMNAWDGQPDKKWYHVTIANRLDAGDADKIWPSLNGAVSPDETGSAETPAFLESVRKIFGKNTAETIKPVFHPPLLDDTGLRITVMNGEKIFAEYDFFEHRWVMTGHEHDSISWQHTMQAFRYHHGYEVHDPAPAHPPAVYVISDLHLGHANIIRYCSRPFLASDPDEMDHVLIKNWNYTVAPDDYIFHLGDIRYGRNAPPFRNYRKRLHGNITFITGNHDDQSSGTTGPARVTHEGFQFLLLHDPAMVPEGFDGWVIHGHHHNNDLRQYPFINFIDRRINVSAEVTGYIPVSLDEIIRLIRERESSGDTAPLLLRPPPVKRSPGPEEEIMA